MKVYFNFFLLTLLMTGCQEQLTYPSTIKGLQLGMDYDEQIRVAENNGICNNDLPDKRCQYKITETVYARPKFYYSLFNDKKVLGQVDLILNSPFNFPTVEDEYQNIIAEYPSITKSEVDDIITMYNLKYGKGEIYKDDDGGTIDWTIGDLFIRLQYYTTMYSYAYQIHPQIKKAFENDAYVTTITYQYSEEKKKLLKNDKSFNGEAIGDKI